MLPVLFKIGTFQVHSFGVMMILAFFFGLWLVKRRAALYSFDQSQVSDIAFWALICGVLGARIVFILQEWGYYSTHPKDLWTLRFEGLTSFGGIIFGLAAMFFLAWRKKIQVSRMLDLFAPGFLLGHVFGRMGCLLNGCCFGGPTTLPWGIHVENSSVLHHPAQAYDGLMNLAGVGILLLIENRRHLKPGQLFGLFLCIHGGARFIYEFWRAGTQAQVDSGIASSTYWGTLPITQAQGVAIGMILIGIGVYALSQRKQEQAIVNPDALAPAVNPKETQPA